MPSVALALIVSGMLMFFVMGTVLLTAVLGPLSGRSFPLVSPTTTVGSVGGNHIVVPDAAVSRLHGLVRRTPAGFELSDLGATHGVWLNGRRVTRPALLVPGDRLRLGESEFVFVVAGAPSGSFADEIAEDLGSS